MIGELALRPLVLAVGASEVAAASDLGLSLGEMEFVLCQQKERKKCKTFFCFKMIMRDMLITFIRICQLSRRAKRVFVGVKRHNSCLDTSS